MAMFNSGSPAVGRLMPATVTGMLPAFPQPRLSAFAPPRRPQGRICKRPADTVLAAIALVLAAPLVLVIALLIRLDSRGPILFRQHRIGLHGAEFEMLKFRTMQHGPGPASPLRQTTPNDPRVTRIGAWLRRTSLDELPQLLNVLRGEMSLVGPRPHAPGTLAGDTPFELVSERYTARHRVRPGMTGLAQIRGWRGPTPTRETLLRRLECDLEYIENWSLRLDLKILLRTAGAVLCMRNAY